MKKYALIAALLTLAACSSTVTAPSVVTGNIFPKVRGESLKQESVLLPDAYRGKNAVLLIGYEQKAQFDIDRWILGLLQVNAPAEIVEVPTIAGMMPQMVQTFINGGMRSGIPQEDWAAVVTVYEDASKIIGALGNDRPQSAYVVLLDKEGTIQWTSNRGYSPTQLLELTKLINP